MKDIRGSRVCVKNIPRYITEEKLREHFAAKGEVTDAKIILTRDGRSRQFGFVGFRTDEEADAAVKYFHRTFFDTSRLSCEIAQGIGDPNLPRPWSRHSQGSSAFDRVHVSSEEHASKAQFSKDTHAHERENGQYKKSKAENDPQLLEFLDVMQPRLKTKIWANDTLIGNDGILRQSQLQSQETQSRRGLAKVEVKTVEGVSRRVPIGKGKTSEKLTQMHVRYEEESDSEYDDAVEVPDVSHGNTPLQMEEPERLDSIAKDDFVQNEAVSDLDYLKSRMSGHWSDDEPEEETVEEVDPVANSKDQSRHEETEQVETVRDKAVAIQNSVDGDIPKEHGEEQNARVGMTVEVDAEAEESVSETGRLFVRNLPYTASEEDLSELFSKYGELSQVHLVQDRATKSSKGYAYILFMLPEAAVQAMEKLDKSIFQGRLIHILPAKRPPPALEQKQTIKGGGPGTTKYKEEREAQRKAAEASGDTRAWNSLYMRPDTVAENVALQYGMSKSEFLDPEAGDLAVRMALGETHIIAETKRALNNEGVDVDVLEAVASGKVGEVKRSNRVILIKNLPFSTLEADLIKLFGTFGTLGRAILPPTKTLALVEYLEASEARRAFKGLAYKRFKHVPLYLEWAPDNILKENSTHNLLEDTKAVPKGVGVDLVKRVEHEQHVIGSSTDDVDCNSAQARSVFVKNLNFSTTKEILEKHFQQHLGHGAVLSVTIKTKLAKNGKVLSMGFGFVEFNNLVTAAAVCKQLQGTVLEGHSLVLQLTHGSKRRASESHDPVKKVEQKKSSTKIIVRNVAFEATKKDLQQLFNPFGQIKSLRLPKKFDGNHRGFAFVEFITRQEAQNAHDALKSTHLYGRHLVLEQAKEGETLDELRARTASQFLAGEDGVDYDNENPRKKTKSSIVLDDTNSAFGQFLE